MDAAVQRIVGQATATYLLGYTKERCTTAVFTRSKSG